MNDSRTPHGVVAGVRQVDARDDGANKPLVLGNLLAILSSFPPTSRRVRAATSHGPALRGGKSKTLRKKRSSLAEAHLIEFRAQCSTLNRLGIGCRWDGCVTRCGGRGRVRGPGIHFGTLAAVNTR